MGYDLTESVLPSTVTSAHINGSKRKALPASGLKESFIGRPHATVVSYYFGGVTGGLPAVLPPSEVPSSDQMRIVPSSEPDAYVSYVGAHRMVWTGPW